MMPTRYIKESACTSPNLAKLSHGAERCLWRLVTKADDYGRFDAAPLVVLGACFPTVPDVTLADVEGWLAEMVQGKAIRLYRAGGRKLGYFTKWEKHQGKPRASASKFPDPPTVARSRGQMRALVGNRPENAGNGPAVAPRIRSRSSSSKSSSSSGVGGPQKVGHILAQNATKIIPPSAEGGA